MNALIIIGLCALSANAQFISGVLPYSGYTTNLLHTTAFTPAVGAPITYAASPIAYTAAAVAPIVAPTTRTSQHHAQDEFGQYNFGYAGGPSSRHEVRDAFGVVRGSYNYIDADGKVQTQNYIADALGFRVAATNLPVAPEAAVEETAEVAAARAAHQKAHDEAAAAAAAAPETSVRRKRSVGSVAIHSAVSPLRFSYGFNTVHPYNFPYNTPALTYTANHAAAPAPAVTYTAGQAVTPLTYSAAVPAAAAPRDATLLRVENNPSHAVSYRVY